jgi:hypothetical protein
VGLRILFKIVDPDNLLFAGRRLVVARLNERDCSGAIAEEVQRLGLEFDAATQVRLARLTGGHPGLLRALSSAAAEGALGAPGSDATLADRLVARADVKARCQKLWDALDPDKQAALHFLANDQVDAVGADTLAWLQDFGLADTGEGAYCLFSPIFQRFVAIQEVSLSTLESVTIVGGTKNERGIIVAGKLFKGSKEVPVTSLELRLIACLKRERKVYTKDDIAAFVLQPLVLIVKTLFVWIRTLSWAFGILIEAYVVSPPVRRQDTQNMIQRLFNVAGVLLGVILPECL